jgi:hypothetical protein
LYGEQRNTTKIIPSSSTPVWNEVFTFDVKDKTTDTYLIVELWNGIDSTLPVLVGSASCEIISALNKTQKINMPLYNSEGNSVGRINITLFFECNSVPKTISAMIFNPPQSSLFFYLIYLI